MGTIETTSESVEETLHFIYGWPEYIKDPTRRRDSIGEEERRARRRTHASLPRALSGRIPFEVVEVIMEQMDQDSLRLCALVCRAWTQASIRVLYRNIAITSRAAFESLAEFVRKDTRAPERLAQTTSLRVGGSKWDVPVHVVPVILARAMPTLQRLIFYSSLHPPMDSNFFLTLPIFRTVSTLELFRFKLCCFSELRQIISAFPQLKSLKLGVGMVEQVTPLIAIIPGARVRLRQLVLGWGLAPSLAVPLLSWLAKSFACVDLTHLAVGRSPFNMALQVNELLAVAGENIQFIHEMDMDSDGSNDFLRELCIDTDLCFLDDLEFLWSTAIDSRREQESLEPPAVLELPLFRDSFSRHCTFAHSPRLHTVRFELRPYTLDDVPKGKWLAASLELDSILETLRSSNIRHIKVHQSVRLTGEFVPLSTHPRLFYAEIPRETLDKGLHRTMRKAIFGTLASVEFSFDVAYVAWEFLTSQRMVSRAAQQFSDAIPRLLGPWHQRGLVTVNMKLSPVYSRG